PRRLSPAISGRSAPDARPPYAAPTRLSRSATMTLTRRNLFKAAATAGLLAPLGVATGCSDEQGSTGTVLRSRAPLPEPFRSPLTVLRVLRPPGDGVGSDRFELTAKKAAAECLPVLLPHILGY